MKITVNYSELCAMAAFCRRPRFLSGNSSRAVISCIDCRNASNLSLPNLIKINQNGGVAARHRQTDMCMNIEQWK